MFRRGDFISHSGLPLKWKIECDDLTDEEIGICAEIIAGWWPFGSVVGIPRGGLRIAGALQRYVTNNPAVLIVDDVLTTGASMLAEAERQWDAGKGVFGAVIFARGACPSWIRPLFQMNEYQHYDQPHSR